MQFTCVINANHVTVFENTFFVSFVCYGNNIKKVKEDEKPKPLSPYTKSKLSLEKFEKK